MSAIITCSGVTKHYQQDQVLVEALRLIDLSIMPGEFVSLAGASGSGKTTLLNLIGGLDQATSGDICVDGTSLVSLDKGKLAKLRLHKIGFVFQAYNLIPVLSAIENVEFIMQLQGISREVRREKALAMLRRVGLEGLEQRRPGELSGGQQQRVAVARAIVSGPLLVLADEPTANLDSQNSEALLALMATLNQEQQVTIVVASHDPLVLEFANRKIGIRDGLVEYDH